MGKNIEQKIAFGFFRIIAFSIVAIIILVVGYIFYMGARVINWEFLTTMPRMGMKEGGIYPAIVGTVCLVLGTIVFALPLGIGSAVYLTEYAKKGMLYRLIRLAIFNLAGVPSVVYGLFGLGLFVYFMKFGQSILAGSLTLACLILPIVIASSEEALLSVDNSYREASLALGVTKLKTIQKVVLPHAMPGILTGTILGMGRAAGETAPILLTVAAFYYPRLPSTVFDQVMALPYHLYIISTQIPGMPKDIQYGTALVLIGIVAFFFAIATIIRIKFRMSQKI